MELINNTVNGVCGSSRDIVVVVVVFFLRAEILGECLTIHSPSALFF